MSPNRGSNRAVTTSTADAESWRVGVDRHAATSLAGSRGHAVNTSTPPRVTRSRASRPVIGLRGPGQVTLSPATRPRGHDIAESRYPVMDGVGPERVHVALRRLTGASSAGASSGRSSTSSAPARPAAGPATGSCPPTTGPPPLPPPPPPVAAAAAPRSSSRRGPQTPLNRRRARRRQRQRRSWRGRSRPEWRGAARRGLRGCQKGPSGAARRRFSCHALRGRGGWSRPRRGHEAGGCDLPAAVALNALPVWNRATPIQYQNTLKNNTLKQALTLEAETCLKVRYGEIPASNFLKASVASRVDNIKIYACLTC